MKTRRAIFWATLALISAMAGLEQEGFGRYLSAAALTLSMFMLWLQTRGRDNDD